MARYPSDHIDIPQRFKNSYEKDDAISGWINSLTKNIEDFIPTGAQQQVFFPEYTNHGIFHINEVLYKADQLIPNATLERMSPYALFYLISAILTHDIGMHITQILFSKLINGSNDGLLKETGHLDDNKSWKELLVEYLEEVSLYPKSVLIEKFGFSEIHFDSDAIEEFLTKIDDCWNAKDNSVISLIGEFIRRTHHRYCHEILILGYPSSGSGEIIQLIADDRRHPPSKKDLHLIGLLARSHCHNLPCPKIESYIKNLGLDTDTPAHNIHIKYLMSVLRIADYISIDMERTGIRDNNTFYNHRSYFEHLKHIKINPINLKEVKGRQIQIVVDKIEPRHLSGPLKTYQTRPEEIDAQLESEIKELVCNIQLELNACTKVISAINEKCAENKYELTFDEIDWTELKYFKRKDETDEEPPFSSKEFKQFKIKPYKFYGFIIEHYIEKADQINNNVDLWIAGSSSEIEKLFIPLELRLLNSADQKPLATYQLSEKNNLPKSNIEGRSAEIKKDINKNEKIWYDILSPGDQARGIIADLGYGKTILCKSLLHFFKLRVKCNPEGEKDFWKDLYYLKELNFIPILYTCRPLAKKYISVREFINDAIDSLDLGTELHEKTCIEIENLFYNQTEIKLLFIVDGVDELVDNLDSQVPKFFMDFLIANIASNRHHTLILTKRRGRLEINKPITRYVIEELNSHQQEKIIEKLSISQKIEDSKYVESFMEVLRNVSHEFKNSAFNLTNFFLYYRYNHKELPTPFELEKHRVQLYFLRKEAPYTPYVLDLLKSVAKQISQTPPYITKSELMNYITNEQRVLEKYENAEKLLLLLTDTVGILKMDISDMPNFTDEPRYFFSNKKIYQSLLFYIDADSLSLGDLKETIVNNYYRDGDSPEFYTKIADLIYLMGYKNPKKFNTDE